MELHPAVNGLPLPKLLVSLMRAGRWTHPGDDCLREIIPFLTAPVDFLTSLEAMARESNAHLADDPRLSAVFHEVRGCRSAEPVELPWRDVARSFFLAVNRFPGDDVGIALDFRTNESDPRVIANDWDTGRGCMWREVVPTFSRFVQKLGFES